MHWFIRTLVFYALLLWGYGLGVEGARNLVAALAVVNVLLALAMADDLLVDRIAQKRLERLPKGLVTGIEMAAAAILIWNGAWVIGALQAAYAAIYYGFMEKIEKRQEALS